jgi:tetratricopeptide (TPR) repeat protein
MTLNWLDARDASKVGVALANDFAPDPGLSGIKGSSGDLTDALRRLFEHADRDVRPLGLNFYKKAKFANSFKWRMLENGVDKELANEVTRQLVVHLSAGKVGPIPNQNPASGPSDEIRSNNPKSLFAHGNQCMSQGAYPEAINSYRKLVEIQPRHAAALNNLGAALCQLGRYQEAEGYFLQAIKFEPNYVDPYSNLGNALTVRGAYDEAESYLRRALKLNPRFVNARANLGLTLANLSRLREAKSHFDKALKIEPRNADALFGLAFVAKAEGHLDEARELADRVLRVNPKMAKALATLISLRKMLPSDNALLGRAEELAVSGVTALDESDLRFAIGKYCDDVGNFDKAFQNYKRANDLLKPIAEPYDRAARKNFVDSMIRVYTQDVVARPASGASDSVKPVFVVGMPRSGTSLTEQIIASHPSARGAGEMEFWSRAVHEHRDAVLSGTLCESTSRQLAEAYLSELDAKSGDGSRIVDKLPRNSDYLGLIHLVFPHARIINMRRDPIDTCLSCYFQKFVPLSFTLELADLADYYRQHERLVAHWRAALPRGTILDVPYEELVADQEGWSRRILDFVGLDWNDQVLEFHKTNRPVVTASFWQVRQKIYDNSVRRWRNYEKYIGPLADLKDFAG